MSRAQKKIVNIEEEGVKRLPAYDLLIKKMNDIVFI